MDAILLAVHRSRVDDVLKQAGDLSGKVIVSCTLPMNADDTRLVIARTSSGAEALAKRNGRHYHVRSPHDLEAFVKVERFVGRHDRDVFDKGLRDDLAVEGVGVMCGQLEETEGMRCCVRQDPQSQISDACHYVRFVERQLPSGLFNRDLGQGNDADLAHRGRFSKSGHRST
jgi:hypothetical protein